MIVTRTMLARLGVVTALGWVGLVGYAGAVRADEGSWRNHMNTAAEAAKRGDHAVAVEMYGAAVKQAEAFGSADASAPDTRLAATLFGLAQAHRAQHSYVPAEASYLRALALLEAIGGRPAHEWSVSIFNGLADIYRIQGRYAEAETYYKKEIAFLEKTHGPEHPVVAQALSNNLGALYRVQSRRDDVETVYRRAIAIL